MITDAQIAEIRARAEEIFKHPATFECECGNKIRIQQHSVGFLTVICDECKQGLEIDIRVITEAVPALIAALEEARAENERLMGIAMRTIAGLAEVKTEMEKTPEKLNRIDIMAREVCEERDALRACSNVASERVNELLTDYNREKERADAYCAYAARLEAQLAEIREKAAPIGAMIEKISLLPDSVELTLEYNDTDFIIVEAGQLRALAAAIGKETA